MIRTENTKECGAKLSIDATCWLMSERWWVVFDPSPLSFFCRGNTNAFLKYFPLFVNSKGIWRYISILQFPLGNQDALTEGKKSIPRCTRSIVHDLPLLLGSPQCTAVGKGRLWAPGKAFLCATWGIYCIRDFLRMPPKLCSLTQPVSRTVLGTSYPGWSLMCGGPQEIDPKRGDVLSGKRKKSFHC